MQLPSLPFHTPLTFLGYWLPIILCTVTNNCGGSGDDGSGGGGGEGGGSGGGV